MAEFRGDKRLMENLSRLIREAPKIVGDALFQEAVKIQKKSMGRTPVEFNALRGSHDTEKPKISSGVISVRIKVGGPSADYAVEVHYRDDLKHAVGESRFLEKSVNEAKTGLAAAVAQKAKAKIHAKMKRV